MKIKNCILLFFILLSIREISANDISVSFDRLDSLTPGNVEIGSLFYNEDEKYILEIRLMPGRVDFWGSYRLKITPVKKINPSMPPGFYALFPLDKKYKTFVMDLYPANTPSDIEARFFDNNKRLKQYLIHFKKEKFHHIELPVGSMNITDDSRLEVRFFFRALNPMKSIVVDNIRLSEEPVSVHPDVVYDEWQAFPITTVSDANKKEVKRLPMKKISDYFEKDERAKILVKRLNDFPKKKHGRKIFPEDNREFLTEVARDTWKYFVNIRDVKNYMPLDFVGIEPVRVIGDFTSTTNVGLTLAVIISGYDMGFVSKEEALKWIKKIVSTIKNFSLYKNQLYNYYDTTLEERTSHLLSYVDGGWLVVGLITVREAFPDELSDIVQPLINKFDFGFYYDKNKGLMSHGFDTLKDKYSKYNYGAFYTEPRAISLLAVSRGDVPDSHWYAMYRTFPAEWDWQRQKPAGEYDTYAHRAVFEGYYTYRGRKFVPYAPSFY